ncbi:MAG TPA: RNA 2',3'-cyclic phosphodiesterase [Prolixibacteraceae bacterium]|jgi:2'-5' RNA ligase
MVGKRVFLAMPLEPVDPAVEKMRQLQELLQKYRIRWVIKENFHVTLFFFGEIPTQQIPVLNDLLHLSLNNSRAFTFSLTSPGIFKKGKEPRVLWLGIKTNDQLVELKREVDKAVSALGFFPYEKTFRPHMTLGRFLPHQKISSELEDVLKEAQIMESIEYSVPRLILFESKSFPAGPQYQPIEFFPLI